MTLLGDLATPGITLALSFAGYFGIFRRFRNDCEKEVSAFEQKNSDKLDKKYLEDPKKMTTAIFLKYHKEIHSMEGIARDISADILFSKWLLIFAIGSFILDGLLEFVSKHIPVFIYPSQIQISLFTIMLSTAILFVVLTIRITSNRRNMKKKT